MLSVRNADELRQFARQDWATAQRDKELYWRDWKKQHGSAAGNRIHDELRKQVLAKKPGWPSDEERREDLETHRGVLEALDRIPPRRSSLARTRVPVLVRAPRSTHTNGRGSQGKRICDGHDGLQAGRAALRRLG